MKVLTTGFGDPMVKSKVMVKRRVAMAQIILVMICVVLPPAGEEHCCIQKVSVKTVSTCDILGAAEVGVRSTPPEMVKSWTP